MELEKLNVFLSQESETYKLNLNSNWNYLGRKGCYTSNKLKDQNIKHVPY